MGQIKPIPLSQGAYEARSVIANAQRCVNLYPEKNTEDSPFPWTLYPTPGLALRWENPTPASARCAYTASNGNFFYVAGASVYHINAGYVASKLGELGTTASPVSIIDNGTTAVIVDGSPQGWLIDLGTNAFSAYAELGFLGSNRVDFLDGFFIFNQPNTRNFYTSLLYTTAIDPTYVAAKSASPDLLRGVACTQRQAYLLGAKTSEVWANAGTPSFPFQAIPGAFIRHGIAATYSIALHATGIYCVMQDSEGRGVIAMVQGYEADRISTPAIEQALSKYVTLNDAVGFCYQQSGHPFYVVSFPSANKTWVYDIEMKMWHERSWCDADSNEQRWRMNVGAFAYDKVLGGDWENGNLYSLELEQYNDFGGPIVRRRGFPHAITSGRQGIYEQFQAEMEAGNASGAAFGEVSLRYSNTRGKSWSVPELQSFGGAGEYALVPQWRQLGQARDMVFELFWSSDQKTALNGAYCEVSPTDA